MTELLKADDITFGYDVHPVIENASFSINKNDIITIIGPNGGGKTTLLRLLMGQLKPQKGNVRINGDRTRFFGYVPQHSELDPSYPVTVREVVLSGRIKSFGFYSRADKDAAEACLQQVGLDGLGGRTFFELSGGQRQRVLIARALASSPEVLLADEPTANIDTDAEKQLSDLLQRLSSELTIVLVTHDLGFVSDITSRVLCVNRRVVEHPVEEVDEELISASYGRQMKVVRHDHLLEKERPVSE